MGSVWEQQFEWSRPKFHQTLVLGQKKMFDMLLLCDRISKSATAMLTQPVCRNRFVRFKIWNFIRTNIKLAVRPEWSTHQSWPEIYSRQLVWSLYSIGFTPPTKILQGRILVLKTIFWLKGPISMKVKRVCYSTLTTFNIQRIGLAYWQSDISECHNEISLCNSYHMWEHRLKPF